MKITNLCRFLTVFGLLAMLPASALAGGWPILTPPPSAPVAVPTSDIQFLIHAGTVPNAYQRLSYNGYSFEIPRSWKGKIQGDNAKEIVFTGADGKRAASLVCPPLPFGLEMMEVDSEARTVIKNGFKYSVELNVATPEGETKPTFAYISMLQDGYKSADKDWSTDPGYGCQLNLDNIKNLTSVSSRIYRSLQVESWNRINAGGLTFSYPKSWTVSSGASGKQKTFKDANGNQVARLDCPIVETGYEAWDFGQFERSPISYNQKTGIITRYAARLWLGKPIQGMSDNQMALILWDKKHKSSYYMPTADSCQLFTNKDGQHGIFREIYKSLK